MYAVVSDGVNSNRFYSEVPVVVDHKAGSHLLAGTIKGTPICLIVCILQTLQEQANQGFTLLPVTMTGMGAAIYAGAPRFHS